MKGLSIYIASFQSSVSYLNTNLANSCGPFSFLYTLYFTIYSAICISFFYSLAGHFIFLQAGFPIQAGARALLTSEMFKRTFHRCMSFWYFMKEAGTATLSVYIVTLQQKLLAWTLSGNQPQESWRYARFPIPHKQAFQVMRNHFLVSK